MEPKINLKLIVQGCLNENRDSQERLYRYYYPYALSICLRYSKDKLEAKEILNEGFLKAFNNLGQFDAEKPFHIWLRKILINTAIDYFRKKQRTPLFIPLEESTVLLAAEEEFDLDKDLDTLPILQQLSPAYRIVFNLYVMEEFKHHEIAEQLGISVNTSKSNLARAKQKLKGLIKSRANYKIIKKQKNG